MPYKSRYPGGRRYKGKGKREPRPAAQPQAAATPAAPAAPAAAAPPRPIAARTSPAPKEVQPDYSYVMADLKRIGIIAGAIIVVLVALYLVRPWG